MGKIRGKIVDRNRYQKRYPFIRAPKRYTYLGDEYLAIELGTLTFNNEKVKQFNFEAPFADTNYVVVATPRDSTTDTGGSAQVSIMVDGTTIDKSFVRIVASDEFTGMVDVIAIKVGK